MNSKKKNFPHFYKKFSPSRKKLKIIRNMNKTAINHYSSINDNYKYISDLILINYQCSLKFKLIKIF